MRKQGIVIILIIGLFGVLAWYVINAFSNYVDVTGLCRIRISGDMLRGNEDTIKEALKSIKASDSSGYKDICRNVDEITERFCVDSDYHLDQAAAQAGWERPGCFIRGSKTIYLKPEPGESASVVKARAREILKDALLSKDYWAEEK